MIQLQNIELAFGGQAIFEGLNWAIPVGKRIGLVGPNGAGKTTLLRVISGTQDVDSGTVSLGGLDIGYLEQDLQEAVSDRSVIEEAMQAFQQVLDSIEREKEITDRLGVLDDHESAEYLRLLHELDEIHVRLAASESHMLRPRAEAVLTGLGFEPDQLERALSTYSGGWRMRVALARLLLIAPDVLLLDEPTNHLDIDSIAWLEDYLKSYPGTVVIVSHDRYFLDRMITTTVELLRGRATEYAGNYSFYLEARKEQRELQAAAYENQQREIEQAESFIRRFRAKATKARQVQSRVKALERLERIPPPPTDEASISIRFPAPTRSGKVAFELSRFSKRYETDEGVIEVFRDADPLIIERGDKIALIGRNGAGKSTLARIINGTEPFDGERTMGYNVELTFFAQHQAESLNPRVSILDEMLGASRGHSETEIRSLLGAFLFTGDDVFKKIGVLSGGERSRVALAKALLQPANFMILDEPTNHLDIQSVNVLIEAMRQYTGSFLVVSHDRHFLDRVTNRVWRVEDGAVRQFSGNYSDYLWQSEHGTASQMAAAGSGRASGNNGKDDVKPSATAAASDGAKRKSKEQKRREAEERKAISGKSLPSTAAEVDALSPYQLKKLYSKVEQKIFQAERRQRKLEQALNDPALYEDLELARQRSAEFEAAKTELDSLYQTWETIAERIETV